MSFQNNNNNLQPHIPTPVVKIRPIQAPIHAPPVKIKHELPERDPDDFEFLDGYDYICRLVFLELCKYTKEDQFVRPDVLMSQPDFLVKLKDVDIEYAKWIKKEFKRHSQYRIYQFLNRFSRVFKRMHNLGLLERRLIPNGITCYRARHEHIGGAQKKIDQYKFMEKL
jgi:hypothetical protein